MKHKNSTCEYNTIACMHVFNVGKQYNSLMLLWVKCTQTSTGRSDNHIIGTLFNSTGVIRYVRMSSIVRYKHDTVDTCTHIQYLLFVALSQNHR